MYRQIVSRQLLRPVVRAPCPRPARLLSTAPPHKKSRSWRSTAARWGLAVGLIYLYNTTNFFRQEAFVPVAQPPSSPSEEISIPTLETLTDEKQKQRQQKQEQNSDESSAQNTPASENSSSQHDKEASQPKPAEPNPDLAEQEEEAHSEGAFNEETGEINWDCPCLGGMAHGPCGEQFREAFSCFVYSKEEPKGMECIEHFKTMQDCFREHPDIYGEQNEDDDGDDEVPRQDSDNERGEPDPPRTGSEAESTRETRSESPNAEEMSAKRHSITKDQASKSAPAPSTDTSVPLQAQNEAISSQQKSDSSQISSDHDLVRKAAHDPK